MPAATAINSGDNNDGQEPAPDEAFQSLSIAPQRFDNRQRLVLPFERPIHELELQLAKLEAQSHPAPNTKDAIANMRVEIARMKRDVFDHLDPWDVVQVARH